MLKYIFTWSNQDMFQLKIIQLYFNEYTYVARAYQYVCLWVHDSDFIRRIVVTAVPSNELEGEM
jgi:hypothetical protein